MEVHKSNPRLVPQSVAGCDPEAVAGLSLPLGCQPPDGTGNALESCGGRKRTGPPTNGGAELIRTAPSRLGSYLQPPLGGPLAWQLSPDHKLRSGACKRCLGQRQQCKPAGSGAGLPASGSAQVWAGRSAPLGFTDHLTGPGHSSALPPLVLGPVVAPDSRGRLLHMAGVTHRNDSHHSSPFTWRLISFSPHCCPLCWALKPVILPGGPR